MSPLAPHEKHFYSFGPFLLDTGERILLRDGQPLALTPKAYHTLLVLVENSGRIVEKDELMNIVWADTFVEDITLAQNISTLRKALGEGQDGSKFIETIPRRGYRFVAETRRLDDAEKDSTTGSSSTANASFRSSAGNHEDQAAPLSESQNQTIRSGDKTRARPLLIVAGAVIVVAFGIYFLLPGFVGNRQPTAESRSIAVLPFKPLVADNRDEGLELGMADTLITKLSNLKGVTVRPISSVRKYSGLEQDAIQAGKALNVGFVLDGHIQTAADRIRVSLRLIDVSSGEPIWAQKFDEKFTDVFSVQDVISERVANALTLELTDDEQRRLAKRYTENTEAYNLYLKGRYYWNKRNDQGIKRAVEFFEQAVRVDPNYALAFSGLADSYSLLTELAGVPKAESFPKAKQAALRALEIDSTLAEAHTSLALVLENNDLDWAGAEQEFKKAIEINPNYATARQWYSENLAAMGRIDEALREIKQAHEIDPVSLPVSARVGVTLYYSRNYDEAVEQLKKTLDMDPDFFLAHMFLWVVYVQQEKFEEAITEFEEVKIAAGSSKEREAARATALQQAYRTSGKSGFWQKHLALLENEPKKDVRWTYFMAESYIHLGDKDRAFEYLNRAVDGGHPALDWVKVDPMFDSLRSDARFAELLGRIGLPN